jgi:SAM-dependent methyltransferase
MDRPLPEAFVAPVRDAAALEIGGPSAVFRTGGLLPLYPACASVDGVQFSDETIWHGRQAGAYAPDGGAAGVLHITDGGTLAGLPDHAYGAVISSHVIEHLADPIGALAAWRRVCVPGAALLIVAPHMEGTFDHRREVTTLEHMIADHEQGVGEDDLTHLDETLRLHDRSRDAEAADQQAWAALRRDNHRHRVLHHHVFTARSLVDLLVHAGIAIEAVEVRYPHDIYVAGRFAERGSVDAAMLAAALARSPFRADAQR